LTWFDDILRSQRVRSLLLGALPNRKGVMDYPYRSLSGLTDAGGV